MIRTSNRDARQYVQSRTTFCGSNIYAANYPARELYVVYSYGAHWPMWVYSHAHKVWIGNKDKPPSASTSRHTNQTHPLTDVAAYLPVHQLHILIDFGASILPELIVTANLPADVA